jgi:hypothetical protein
MKETLRIAALVGLLLSVLGTPAIGQWSEEEIGSTLTPEQEEAAAADQGGFGFHYQVGAMKPVATNMTDHAKADYVVTADLVGLTWSRTRSTWGAGLHFAFTDNGNRLGVKGLWRTPLKKGTWSYLQVAGGLYVTASEDAFVPKLPGFFLEGEVGLAREFALVVAVEAMAYEDLEVDYVMDPVTHDGRRILESGTATSISLGGRLGQVGGVALTVIGIVAGIAALASFAGSGGVM